MPAVPSVPACAWSPTGHVDWEVPESPGLEAFQVNSEGKAKSTKVTSREDTVVEFEDD